MSLLEPKAGILGILKSEGPKTRKELQRRAINADYALAKLELEGKVVLEAGLWQVV